MTADDKWEVVSIFENNRKVTKRENKQNGRFAKTYEFSSGNIEWVVYEDSGADLFNGIEHSLSAAQKEAEKWLD